MADSEGIDLSIHQDCQFQCYVPLKFQSCGPLSNLGTNTIELNILQIQ